VQDNREITWTSWFKPEKEKSNIMNRSLFARIVLAGALFALAGSSLAGSALAQDVKQNNVGAKPMFVTLPARTFENWPAPPTGTVTNWEASFLDGTQKFTFKMVGTNPKKTNVTTTVTTYIIPIAMVCDGMTFDPQTIQGNGQTAVQLTTSSPIFNAGIDFVQGGTDVGNTQYLDAFQRANFWNQVRIHPGYHVLLSQPIVLPEQTLQVPSSQCSIGNPFGFGNVGIVDINYFDSQLQSLITSMSVITPNSFVIGMTYNAYLSGNSGLSGCCIGGYHSAFGSPTALQTYSHFTLIPFSGQFSQDVSALSHEVGEWVDDPFINNNTEVSGGCQGILEVGDPLEVLANFGDFPYTLNGFVYHLQDLCFLDYWSGNTVIPVNNWYTFQNEKHAKCS
jgi:hypothetical protein